MDVYQNHTEKRCCLRPRHRQRSTRLPEVSARETKRKQSRPSRSSKRTSGSRASTAPASVVTFDQAAASYAEGGGETRYLLRVMDHFKGVRLGSIKPGHILDSAKKLLPKCSPSTQRRQVITPAVAVINHGHQRGWCAPIKVKSKTGKTPARKAVDRDYIDALRSRCTTRAYPAPHLGALMLFVHQTGARIGEAMGLEPKDVDLRNGTAIAYDTKNGEDRLIDLTPEIIEEYSARSRQGTAGSSATSNRGASTALSGRSARRLGWSIWRRIRSGVTASPRRFRRPASQRRRWLTRAAGSRWRWCRRPTRTLKDAGKRAAEAMASRGAFGAKSVQAE